MKLQKCCDDEIMNLRFEAILNIRVGLLSADWPVPGSLSMVSMAFTKLSSNFSLVDKTSQTIIKHVCPLNVIPFMHTSVCAAFKAARTSLHRVSVYVLYVCLSGCHGNALCHGQIQLLDLPLHRRLQVTLIHRILHKERLQDERHEDTGRTGSEHSVTTS